MRMSEWVVGQEGGRGPYWLSDNKMNSYRFLFTFDCSADPSICRCAPLLIHLFFPAQEPTQTTVASTPLRTTYTPTTNPPPSLVTVTHANSSRQHPTQDHLHPPQTHYHYQQQQPTVKATTTTTHPTTSTN